MFVCKIIKVFKIFLILSNVRQNSVEKFHSIIIWCYLVLNLEYCISSLFTGTHCISAIISTFEPMSGDSLNPVQLKTTLSKI